MRIWNGPSGSTGGGRARASMIASNSGVMSPSRTPGVQAGVAVQRRRVDDRGSRAGRRSRRGGRTGRRSGRAPSPERAPGRSTLLTTTIGLKPIANAFCVTKRVCGIGPSIASTRISTESTIDSTRSTSPPKSACPGVSTMLMRYSSPLGLQRIAVFFDRIVMPRSFSRSLLSITRSVARVRSLKRAGLLEQLVDEGGLAMVDVGDDGDVAEVRGHGVAGGGDVHLCAAQR